MRIIKDKKGLALESIVLYLIVFSFFIVAGWSFYSLTAIQYDVVVNDSFSEPFDKVNETFTIANQVADDFQESEATVKDAIVSFITSGISSIKIIFGSISIITDLTFVVATTLGIPQIVVDFFLAIMMVVVVFAIIRVLVGKAQV